MRDQRKYPRTASGTQIRYRRLASDEEELEYVDGVVENVGLGGVFINTDDPLPRGSVVELEMHVSVGGRDRTIGAKALVKWNRKMFPPTGMGLEFVEFSGLGESDLSDWLQGLVGADQT